MLFICVIVLTLQSSAARDTVPAFLLDYDKGMDHILLVEPNPFAKTSSILFTHIIEDVIRQSSVLILFVEEHLSTEDISSRDENGTPFVNLRNNMKNMIVKYIPNVVNPISAITRLLKPTQTNVFLLNPGELFSLNENMNYFYVFFNDYNNETRVEALRRHDILMEEVYARTRKMTDGPVAAIYTGKMNPVVFKFEDNVSLHKSPRTRAKGVYVASEGALFRFVGMNIQLGDRTRRSELPEVPQLVSEARTRSKDAKEYLRTNLEFQGLELRFSFQLTRTHWYLDNITLVDADEELGSTVLGIRVPARRSYYCNEPLVIVNANDNSYISIPEYQIQPFGDETRRQGGDTSAEDDKNNTNATKSFNNSLHCNPYFNIPILAGITVVTVLLSILMAGIVTLFNCTNNDRFDDPHQKPIVITTTE